MSDNDAIKSNTRPRQDVQQSTSSMDKRDMKPNPHVKPTSSKLQKIATNKSITNGSLYLLTQPKLRRPKFKTPYVQAYGILEDTEINHLDTEINQLVTEINQLVRSITSNEPELQDTFLNCQANAYILTTKTIIKCE